MMIKPVPRVLKEPMQALQDLPAMVNAFAAKRDGLSFFVMPINTAFGGYSTFMVQVSCNEIPVAVYQCNAEYVRGWMVFSLLVITWAVDGVRPPGSGRTIMGHCLNALDMLSKTTKLQNGILLTSGNLTEERAGLPFFTMLGWETVFLPERFDKNNFNNHLDTDALYFVAERIAEASAAFRAAGEGISFAFINLQAPRPA